MAQKSGEHDTGTKMKLMGFLSLLDIHVINLSKGPLYGNYGSNCLDPNLQLF